ADMDKVQQDYPYPGCFFSLMKEGNPSKHRANIHNFFRELPSQDDDGQVLPISGLWKTAMAHPIDPEFIELGIFESMSTLIWKGLKNRWWLSHDRNIYIIRCLNRVIPSLVELFRGRLTWVEQRVAVRALRHLTTHANTFSTILNHDEILKLSIQ
ncbi:Porphobilinogen deaminase, partial [Bienertia sinuspersici]